MKNKKGFTLIEILIVVLIIGILAAVAVPQYQLASDKAKYAAMMNITRAIADSNERYYQANNKTYATRFDQLDVNIPANSIDGGDAYFDWGNCHLYYQQEVQCTNDTSLKNQFIKLYDRSTSNLRGGVFCTAKGIEKNTRQDKVCKSVGEYLYSTGSGTGCFFSGSYWTGCRLYAIRR